MGLPKMFLTFPPLYRVVLLLNLIIDVLPLAMFVDDGTTNSPLLIPWGYPSSGLLYGLNRDHRKDSMWTPPSFQPPLDESSSNSVSPPLGPFARPAYLSTFSQAPEPANRHASLVVLFGLVQRHLTEAENLLFNVSSPLSNQYGEYITAETWKDLFAPTTAQRQTMDAHLREKFRRTPQFSLTGDFVKIGPVTVEEVQQAYNTTILEFEDPETHETALRVNRPIQLPEEVKPIVEFVNLAAPLHYYTKNTMETQSKHNGPDAFFRSSSSTTTGFSDTFHDTEAPLRHFVTSPYISPASRELSSPPYTSRLPPPTTMASSTKDSSNQEAQRRFSTSLSPYPSHMKPGGGRGIAPLVNPYTYMGGDGFLVLDFMPYCADGSPNVINFNAKQKTAICGYQGEMEEISGTGTPPHIVGFEVILHQPETQVTKIVEMPCAYPVLGSSEAICGEGVPCVQLNTTIGDIPNYTQTWISIRSQFSTGEYSPFSPYSEVPPIWALPYMTPLTLAALYNIPLNLPITSSRSTIAVAEFLNQFYNQTDLDEFFRLTGVPKQSPPLIIGVNDPLWGGYNGTEAQLDIQYIMGLASNVTTWFWSVSGRNAHTRQEPFLDWLFQISDTYDGVIPLVHSVSYGDDEGDIQPWYAKRLNVEFLKMGLRGLTVLVASGDDGASGFHSRTNSSFCDRSHPEIPAALPYVTAVGGTQLARNSAAVCGTRMGNVVVQCHYDREKACMANTGGGITSGGGFSNYFTRPWYQDKLVNHYLDFPDSPLPTSSDLSAPYFNVTGRAYPDISTYSNNYLVLMDGEFTLVHGTSASTPLLASLICHLNDIRIRNNMPVLGFINPLLYYWAEFHPEGFQDILVGDNRCGVSPYNCCEKGFPASRGWDAVTGIGTPKFDVLAKLAGESTKRIHRNPELVHLYHEIEKLILQAEVDKFGKPNGISDYFENTAMILSLLFSGFLVFACLIQSLRGTFRSIWSSPTGSEEF